VTGSPPADKGAQAERTRLAWRRTALAMTAVGMLVIRMALHRGLTPGRAAAVVAACGVWLFFLVLAQRRIWALARPAEPMARSAVLGALCFLGMAAVGAVLCIADLC
jgi:uncharacterized membrane protein YidH (DUF202 family)